MRELTLCNPANARQDKENSDHRWNRNRWLSGDRPIQNDPTDQPSIERRSRGAAANQDVSQACLLRLSLQRNPMALVLLHRSNFMVG